MDATPPPHNTVPVPRRYLNTAEAADYLGISARFFSTIRVTHNLPCAKLGKRNILFRITDLDAFIEAFFPDADKTQHKDLCAEMERIYKGANNE